MLFCIRDDDTSFFTSPDDLERAYGEIARWGPVSLAVVPFHRAGTSKGVPENARGRWSVHPLHENEPLVEYLRSHIASGRFEVMLHGYHHDEHDGRPEFTGRHDLDRRVAVGRRYLEELLGTTIRVVVPPRTAIRRHGLRADARSGLHLGGTAGLRGGWPLTARETWSAWHEVRRWTKQGGQGLPWVLDLGDHREIAGQPITPAARHLENEAAFKRALALDGVFCAATHYWELDASSHHVGAPTVRDQLRRLVDLAMCDARVTWRSVGDVVSHAPALT
jgi:hypothetical protein